MQGGRGPTLTTIPTTENKQPNKPWPRRELNRLDNAKGARATDALLNYETVKYFANEDLERRNFAKVCFSFLF